MTHAVKTQQRTYCAVIERGCLRRVPEFIPGNASGIFVVTERSIWERYGRAISGPLQGCHHDPLFFPGGEVNKRVAALEDLAERMVAEGADRASVIIAIGGGIVTDVGGFLAAVFMRGIPVIQVPTTLLAQVDAAVGGKTGVNLAAGKNLIGSFHQPLAVLIDPLVLESLPEREYRAGLFEIIKCGVIADEALFEVMRVQKSAILSRDPAVLERIISDSVQIKANVVSLDEKEGGLRRILNFGHTFGHALEAETGYTRFLHGEAVGWGMKAAVDLARRERILDDSRAAAILACIDSYESIPPVGGIDPAGIVARLKKDKKTLHGRVHFVLPDRIGHTRIVTNAGTDNVIAAVRTALGA